ncbi:hypothetical protein GGR55DRAFT_556842 [Xylaria sp. FL0064]|nr:hypothetical protein GGR55DRAFT_556842 [Xylaria sp. FL0064]
MMLSLLILIALASILQVYVGDIYSLTRVGRGLAPAGPDFVQIFLNGLRAEGLILVIGVLGIYTIKFNFLLFFYRLGHQIRIYRVVWWVAMSFVAASLAVSLGIIPYNCTFGDPAQIIVQCTPKPSVDHIYIVYKLTVALDVICDAIIIAFPVMTTWMTKMTLRQKIVLSSVFLLVGLTIGVTVVRGSIFGGVYTNGKIIDVAWVSFWLYVEISVSFFINCAISFRSLWITQKRKAQNEASDRNKQTPILIAQQADEGWKAKIQLSRRSLLGVFARLEGTPLESQSGDFIQHKPPSGNMTVGSSNWGTTQDSEVAIKSELRS